MRSQHRRPLAVAATATGVVAAVLGGMAPPAQAAVLTAASTTPVVDNSTRAGALAAYQNVHLPATKVMAAWTGSIAGCLPGSPGAAAHDAMLTDINYYRSMVGLAPATSDPSWDANAQAAALLQTANAAKWVTADPHNPTTDWTCYTSAGATGSHWADLALASGPRPPALAVDSWIDDNEVGTAGVEPQLAHRFPLLDPRRTTLGVGATDTAAVVLHSAANGFPPANPATMPAYVTWPDAGYVPTTLLPRDTQGREMAWSVSISDDAVNPTTAVVTMKETATGKPIPVTMWTKTNWSANKIYSNKTAIKFAPATGSLASPDGSDKSFTVTVSGLTKNGAPVAPYTYTTTLFDPSRALSPQTVTWTSTVPATAAVGATTTLAAKSSTGLPVTYSASPASACTVSGSILTYVGAGTCTVTASQAGNGTYAAATTTATTTVTAKAQTITWTTAPSATTTAGATSALAATASTGLPVTYRASPAGTCTVSGSTLSLLGVGTCTVTATQSGSSVWAPVSSSRTTNVQAAGQTVTWTTPAPATAVARTSATVAAQASSGLALTYASATPAVCSVAGSAVRYLAAGTCTVTATQAGSAAFAPARATSSTTVSRAAQTIAWTATGAPTPAAKSTTTLTSTSTSGLPVTYASSTPGTCTVAGDVVSFTNAGACTVTAAQTGDATWAPATATASYQVQLATQTFTWATPLPAASPMYTSTTLTAASSSGRPVTYSTTTPATCTVAGTVLSYRNVGTCTVTATTGATSAYAAGSVTASTLVQLAPAPPHRRISRPLLRTMQH